MIAIRKPTATSVRCWEEHARVSQKAPKDVLREPIEGIRATVIGAGEYTIQASGNTSYVSNEKALPVHGLKVIQAPIRDGESVSEALKQALRKFDLPRFTSGLALSLTVSGVPDYQSVRRIAEGVAEILKDADDPKMSTLSDLGSGYRQVAWQAFSKMNSKSARDIIAVDGIEVGDLDYIDIGECLGHHGSYSGNGQIADVPDRPCRLALVADS